MSKIYRIQKEERKKRGKRGKNRKKRRQLSFIGLYNDDLSQWYLYLKILSDLASNTVRNPLKYLKKYGRYRTDNFSFSFLKIKLRMEDIIEGIRLIEDRKYPLKFYSELNLQNI